MDLSDGEGEGVPRGAQVPSVKLSCGAPTNSGVAQGFSLKGRILSYCTFVHVRVVLNVLNVRGRYINTHDPRATPSTIGQLNRGSLCTPVYQARQVSRTTLFNRQNGLYKHRSTPMSPERPW